MCEYEWDECTCVCMYEEVRRFLGFLVLFFLSWSFLSRLAWLACVLGNLASSCFPQVLDSKHTLPHLAGSEI